MNTKQLLNQINILQEEVAPIIDDLRLEHRKLAARAKEDKQAADEQVSVAAMLLAVTRASRELTKVLAAYKWYTEHVLPKKRKNR